MSQQQQPYKTCPHCGQNAVLSMPACGRCGTPFRSDATATDAWKIGILLFVFIAVIGSIAVLYLAFKHLPRGNQNSSESIVSVSLLIRQSPSVVEGSIGAPSKTYQARNYFSETVEYREYVLKGQAHLSVCYKRNQAVEFAFGLKKPSPSYAQALRRVGLDMRGKKPLVNTGTSAVWSRVTINGTYYETVSARDNGKGFDTIVIAAEEEY